jgi:hypothetical protein
LEEIIRPENSLRFIYFVMGILREKVNTPVQAEIFHQSGCFPRSSCSEDNAQGHRSSLSSGPEFLIEGESYP